MTNRAEFLSSLAVGAAGVCTSGTRFPATMRKPPMVRRGDRVGLIAPASPLSDAEIENGIAHMRALGLVPVLGNAVHDHDGYLAGSDAVRADDFNRMARDPQINAIVALRGGYGTMRILDGLDYDALRSNPKVVMGFSDMTAILNAIAQRSGIITFHGPVASLDSQYGEVARSFITRAWMSPEPIGVLHASNTRVIRGGIATGCIAGGNLSLVSALEGTPYAIASEGALLLLEETQEQPYRIDRMLTQLRLAGTLQRANGVVFGRCTQCIADGPSMTADEVLADRLGNLDRPAIAGVPVGHIDDQWVLPIGLTATLNVDRATLTIPESAVVKG